jgi:hypothetical protein
MDDGRLLKGKIFSLYVFVISVNVVEYFERYNFRDNIATSVLRRYYFLGRVNFKILDSTISEDVILSCLFISTLKPV